MKDDDCIIGTKMGLDTVSDTPGRIRTSEPKIPDADPKRVRDVPDSCRRQPFSVRRQVHWPASVTFQPDVRTFPAAANDLKTMPFQVAHRDASASRRQCR